ncbi:hypothetical protein Xbed_01933 [Xenorhabdus beddingii]|uniref:Uncharacterized protein n=1 Tax=Xenorhabdus beddingii TaxID=40578 RepID=A0A1Y2SP92_9GAMM|nr:hypothetical protein [Xenorhabdus beddingii]OTA20002.1 hypothetical protein Xbed_01933 [Xenorhabdus beddingii]
MSVLDTNLLPAPQFPQDYGNGKINISDVRAMGSQYILMQVDKYDKAEVEDKIEGVIYLKNDTNTKVKSVPYTITPDKLKRNYHLLLFHVSEIEVSGLYEAEYTVTELINNQRYSLKSNITFTGSCNMNTSGNEVIFLDAKNSTLDLRTIKSEGAIKIRAKFTGLVDYDNMVITIESLKKDGSELKSLSSASLPLLPKDIQNGYKDYDFSINKFDFIEADSFIANFSITNKQIISDYTQVTLLEDLDTINVKVQTTKNIAGRINKFPDIKPLLSAIIYTEPNNKLNAQLTNAYFNNGITNTEITTNDKGVGYLYIYSDDITKNSVLSLNYDNPVIAYNVPLSFANWKSSSDGMISYTYSSYGVADGICECELLIQFTLKKPAVTGITVSFDSTDIMINNGGHILEITHPDVNNILVYKLKTKKAVRSNFTVSVTGVSMDPINNTIVFIDPLTF